MEEVKKINRVVFIVVLIKILGGLLTHSYTLIASSLLELLLIIISKVAMIKKEDSKCRRVITTILGLIMILSSVLLVVFSIKYPFGKVSAWIILFAFIIMIVKYMTSCYYTNVSYRRKNGVLSFGNVNSTIDFISFAAYIAYRGILVILHSVKAKDEEKVTQVLEGYKAEIVARKEIKRVERLALDNYGGLNYAKCGIVLSEGISMIDANTFVITLQDYLLKIADVVKIDLVDPNIKPKHVKVRSLKEDARNSRSRNSKTNTKKKNTTKKNKKR